MRTHLAAAALALLAGAGPAPAQLHLGMKLACKRYGDAFAAGRQADVAAACTPEFGKIWLRMPAKAFASLPRLCGGELVSSAKGACGGTVTVRNGADMVSFVLEGHGFDWLVADIRRTDARGAAYSVREYMDIGLTANEFMTRLKGAGGGSFQACLTADFRRSFGRLSADEVGRIRDFLPDPRVKYAPDIRIDGSGATMTVRVPDGAPDETACFALRRQDGWKIDDLRMTTRRAEIPSFRRSLALLASVTGFGDFVRRPGDFDPRDFTAPGPLQDILVWARTRDPFPLPVAGRPDRSIFAKDGQSAVFRYPDRVVRFAMDDSGGRPLLAVIETQTGDRWSNVATMLRMKRDMESVASATAAFASWAMGDGGRRTVAAAPTAGRGKETPTAPASDSRAAPEASAVAAAPPSAPAALAPPSPIQPAGYVAPAPATRREVRQARRALRGK